MKFFWVKSFGFLCPVLLPLLGLSQTNTNGSNLTAIPTAVPFLNISPDSRSSAMGDAGVAITPDANANYWNPSKLAFLEDEDVISLSYSPWLRQLVPDISLSYLSYGHKIDDRNSIGASLRYFNYGSIQFRDVSQNDLGTYSPNEFALNGTFARKFGDEFSLGLTAGFIRSNLSNAFFSTGSGVQARAGSSIAAGVSLFYNKPLQEFGDDGIFSLGANISNIGSKISYSDVGPSYFLPANLKIGAANTLNLDDYNQFTFTVDVNKLLVPTPPIRDANGNIIKGKDDNVSVPAGIFGAFTSAPGGFSETLQEFTLSTGAEYWYNKTLAVRAGYFYENPNKGGLNYITVGAGFKYQSFNFDFSYLLASQQTSPRANTLRFTLIANFGGEKSMFKK